MIVDTSSGVEKRGPSGEGGEASERHDESRREADEMVRGSEDLSGLSDLAVREEER